MTRDLNSKGPSKPRKMARNIAALVGPAGMEKTTTIDKLVGGGS